MGIGLASVFNEVGTIENPAAEKLSRVLLLAKGADLPPFDEQVDGRAKNQYAELFKKIFGIHWRGMITLHKLLTLSQKELVSALEYHLVS